MFALWDVLSSLFVSLHNQATTGDYKDSTATPTTSLSYCKELPENMYEQRNNDSKCKWQREDRRRILSSLKHAQHDTNKIRGKGKATNR